VVTHEKDFAAHFENAFSIADGVLVHDVVPA
jgi:hypothetical protein